MDRTIEAFIERPHALPLQGAVQHYDWGGYDFIPDLLDIDNEERRPFAELWMSAHPSAPASTSVDGVPATLDQLIAAAPQTILGTAVADRFAGRLPYLFKVLDARKMLSIQAHPTKAQAEEGFARENAAGIALKAPNRNYKDDNHKPEVHVVLTEFWMLHGFRPLEEIAIVLQSVPELSALAPDFTERLEQVGQDEIARKVLLRSLYETVMTLPQSEVDALLNPLLTRLSAQATSDKDSPDFWALRAANEFPLPGGHRDRGIFSIYLLNLLHLKPGQGTYQPAGVLHAYLEGVNMELMANSDNVLRGGLTPKHVDVPELMQTLTFESGVPAILAGEYHQPTEALYPTPSPEFALSRITLENGQSYSANSNGPDTLIVLEGAATVETGGKTFPLTRGEILFIPVATAYTILARQEPATLFKAAVPTI